MRWCWSIAAARPVPIVGWRKAIQFDVADKFGVLLQPEPCIV